ncbi:obscurin-like [Pseudorasbora parva]|uniref:obscurin-like n=1 Tax=Pseudorasbora parva TaxID=51549 RepID=UPI00351F2A99
MCLILVSSKEEEEDVQNWLERRMLHQATVSDWCVWLMRLMLGFHTSGIIGANKTDVFSTSGENVRLPCNNALSDCTSTTWNYNRDSSQTVELINGGIKKNDTERRERLSVGSDCSLNIKNATQEDYGLYTCRQYVNGQQQGNYAPVYLHFLHVSVSSSSSQSEIRSGRSVTLSCQLYSYFPCDTLVLSEGIQLMWVNQANVNLMTDSRYQILFSSTHCTSTLTTTLLNEDHNREWRCQLTQNNQLKASATITVKDLALVDSSTLIPVSSSNSEKSNQTTAAPTQDNKVFMDDGSLFRVIMIILEIAAFAAPTVILLQIICARRAGRKGSDRPEEMEMSTVLE